MTNEKPNINTPTVESDVRVHLVFCPRRTRNLFNLEDVSKWFEVAVANVGTRCGATLIAHELGKNFVHLYVMLPYQMSTKDLVYQYKLESTKLFHEHIPELQNTKQIWSAKYMAMTDEPSEKDIEQFVARHWIRP